ncbi:MAG: Crp/Fnr family transcriptional regulator [Gammaproteobacteria bacterium]
MSRPLNATDNALLAAFHDAAPQSWMAQLEPVEMPLGMTLYEAGCTLRHVYFPTSAIVSLLCLTESGATAEIATVGHEGLIGVSLFMGGGSTTCSAVVQTAGFGYRIKGHLLHDEFNRAGPVMHQMLRYTQTLITQMTQTAVCYRHHSLERQLCRWLLQTLDRLPGNDIVMTQQLIARALGVRREGVTEGALKLQRAGLIRYSRGHITVLDRLGLEQHACECYAVVTKECDRLRPGAVAA